MTERAYNEEDHRIDWDKARWGDEVFYSPQYRKWIHQYWFCNGVDPTHWCRSFDR